MSVPAKLGRILLVMFVFTAVSRAGQWVEITPLNTPRAGVAGVVWQNKIYVFGGKSINNRVLNTVEIYDPKIGIWDTTSVPPFDKERYNAAAVVFKNKIYLIGGRDDDDVLEDVEVYDPAQNSWSDAQDLPSEREGLSATVLNGHIYVMGGQNEDHYILNKIEWYDESEDEWKEEKDKMPQPKVAPLSISVENLFYMFGGYYFGLTKTFYTAIVHDGKLKWNKNIDMPQARAYGVAIQKKDSIFLVGGETSSGITNDVTIFDLSNKVFSQGAPLNTPRSGLTGVALNDTLYAIGGYSVNNVPLNTVEMYVPVTTDISNWNNNKIPNTTILINGYPNPFNGAISIQISLTRIDFYTITLYNALGDKIKTIYSGILNNGRHRFVWRGKDETGNDTGSGIYFLRVQSRHAFATYKMVYIK